jgi:hypothetical protein
MMAVAVMLTGCGPSETTPHVSPEQQLAERAEARWKALAEGDLQAVYGFESPAYRDVTPLGRYAAQYGSAVKWHGGEASSIKLGEDGQTARVNVAVDYTSVMPSGEQYQGRRAINEDWILADGEWWYVRK